MIEVVPFVKIVPLDNDLLRERIDRLAGEEITAVFTSANSVLQVTEMLSQVPRWHIACLEGNTGKEAIRYFGAEAIRWMAPDAAALAKQLEIAGPADKTIFFCGDKRLDYLPQALKAAGNAVEEIVVYETHSTPVLLTGAYDGMLFFSPSSVESFFSLNNLPLHTLVFAIGATTAQSLKQYTTNKIIISPEHNAKAMTDQIIACFTHEK